MCPLLLNTRVSVIYLKCMDRGNTWGLPYNYIYYKLAKSPLGTVMSSEFLTPNFSKSVLLTGTGKEPYCAKNGIVG